MRIGGHSATADLLKAWTQVTLAEEFLRETAEADVPEGAELVLVEAVCEPQMVLHKALGHKYIKRVPYVDPKTGRTRYRYWYQVPATKHLVHSEHLKVGTAFQHAGGHWHVTKVHKDGRVAIKCDETGKTETVTEEELRKRVMGHVKKHHKKAIGKRRAKLKATHAEAKKYGSKKQIARAKAALDDHHEVYGGAEGGKETKPKATKEDPSAYLEREGWTKDQADNPDAYHDRNRGWVIHPRRVSREEKGRLSVPLTDIMPEGTKIADQSGNEYTVHYDKRKLVDIKDKDGNKVMRIGSSIEAADLFRRVGVGQLGIQVVRGGERRKPTEPAKPAKGDRELTAAEKRQIEEARAKRKPKGEKPKGGTKPVWQMGRSQYQSGTGVHRPWIGEISPAQYANMSKRAKREYDKKRDREWSASAKVGQDYRDKVVQAWKRGEVGLKTKDLHPDAKDAILGAMVRESKETREKALKEALSKNRVRSVDDVQVGDRVYSLMYDRYGTVTKKYKKSVRLKFGTPLVGGRTEVTEKAGALQRKHYNDVKADVEAALESNPSSAPSPAKEGEPELSDRAKKLRAQVDNLRDAVPESGPERTEVKHKPLATKEAVRKRLAKFASKDEGRPNIMQIYITRDGKAVATDGHRIAVAPTDVKVKEDAMHDPKTMERQGLMDVDIDYPDYTRAIPVKDDGASHVSVKSAKKIADLARALPRKDKRTDPMVAIKEEDDGQIHMAVVRPDKKDYDWIRVGGGGKRLYLYGARPLTGDAVHVNAKYLSEVLQGAKGSLQIQTNGEYNGIRIDRGDGEVHVVMPIRKAFPSMALSSLSSTIRNLQRFAKEATGDPLEKTVGAIRSLFDQVFGDGSYAKISVSKKAKKSKARHDINVSEGGPEELGDESHGRYVKAKKKLAAWAGTTSHYGASIASMVRKKLRGKKKDKGGETKSNDMTKCTGGKPGKAKKAMDTGNSDLRKAASDLQAFADLNKAVVKTDKHGRAILTSDEQELLLRGEVRDKVRWALQRKYGSEKRGGLYGQKTQAQIVDEICDEVIHRALEYDDRLLGALRDLKGDAKEGGTERMRGRLSDMVGAEYARQEPEVKAASDKADQPGTGPGAQMLGEVPYGPWSTEPA